MSRRLLATGVGLALVLGAAPSAGFELLRVNKNPCAKDDQHVFWGSSSAGVSTGNLPEPFRGLADEARLRWNEKLVGKFRFFPAAGRPCNLRDGVTALDLADVSCDGEGFGDAVALTLIEWNSSGELVDADIVFDVDSFLGASRAMFRQVAMHELGHVLGLDHSDACEESGDRTLMKKVLTQRFDEPQPDDVDGARFIYGGGVGGDGQVPEGANACAVVGPCASCWPGLPFLMVPALLGLRLIQRLTRG